jgi:molecular chaperone GrpE
MRDPQEKQGEQNQNEEGRQGMQNSQQAQSGQVTEEAHVSAEAQIAALEQQLAQARQEASDNWNKYLRERAEMDNFRKRQVRMGMERAQQEKARLLNKILEVVDNIDRAMQYQDKMDRQELLQTMRMLLWHLNEVLRNEGLEPIPSVGQAFDPYVHEAIESVENSDQPEGTVVEEVLKGYKLGNETFRPARVKVSAGQREERA